jgi:hypothetical protein
VKKKKPLPIFSQVLGLIGLLILLISLLLIPYHLLRNALLSGNGAKMKAVIIDEENYFGNNTRRFAYSYRFYRDGRPYTGNSLRSSYHVGDSVWVKYVPSFPRFNRIIEQGE